VIPWFIEMNFQNQLKKTQKNMKKTILLIPLLSCFLIFGQTPSNDPHWRLVWEDNFNSFDASKWLKVDWAQPKSILTTALDGYAYGSEKGQVKQISDHNHIIALYDYGVGTYDFDMSKVQPQIKLAQAKAEEKIIDFFK